MVDCSVNTTMRKTAAAELEGTTTKVLVSLDGDIVSEVAKTKKNKNKKGKTQRQRKR